MPAVFGSHATSSPSRCSWLSSHTKATADHRSPTASSGSRNLAVEIGTRMLQVRGNLTQAYDDVLTAPVVAVLNELAPLDADRRAIMQSRLERRDRRRQRRERIAF